MKHCGKCTELLPLDKFHAQRDGAFGRQSYCKECTNAVQREKRVRNYSPENKRKWQLKTRYGLTPETFDAMLAAQGGACALCKTPANKYHVDHCHNSGAVRGLLWHRCNICLGGWDDLTWRSNAMRYLGIEK